MSFHSTLRLNKPPEQTFLSHSNFNKIPFSKIFTQMALGIEYSVQFFSLDPMFSFSFNTTGGKDHIFYFELGNLEYPV
jgi:hypothetical protein